MEALFDLDSPIKSGNDSRFIFYEIAAANKFALQ